MVDRTSRVVPAGWTQFDRAGLSVAYPPGWRKLDPPLSEGATLCITNDAALIEIFIYGQGKQDQPLVDFIAQSIADIMPFEAGLRNGRVVSRTNAEAGVGVGCHHVEVAYEERGESIVAHYVVVGTRAQAVQIGLKTRAGTIESLRSDFSRILATLTTRWLPQGVWV